MTPESSTGWNGPGMTTRPSFADANLLASADGVRSIETPPSRPKRALLRATQTAKASTIASRRSRPGVGAASSKSMIASLIAAVDDSPAVPPAKSTKPSRWSQRETRNREQTSAIARTPSATLDATRARHIVGHVVMNHG